jgi:hypothetical protein
VQYDLIFDVLLVQILLLWARRSCEGWVVQHHSCMLCWFQRLLCWARLCVKFCYSYIPGAVLLDCRGSCGVLASDVMYCYALQPHLWRGNGDWMLV